MAKAKTTKPKSKAKAAAKPKAKADAKLNVTRPEQGESIRTNFTAFGRAQRPDRVRGIAIGKKGEVVIGEALKSTKKTWAVRFIGLPKGAVTFFFFDFLELLFTARTAKVKMAMKPVTTSTLDIIWPLGPETVDSEFWAEGNTTTGASLNMCRMENEANAAHFYDAMLISQPIGSDYWSAMFVINPINNDYKLRVSDSSSASDSEQPITVQQLATKPIKKALKKKKR